MKDLLKKFENTMAAVAFAEAGEHETAKAILSEDTNDSSPKTTSTTIGCPMCGAPKGANA